MRGTFSSSLSGFGQCSHPPFIEENWVIDQYQVCTDKRSGITSDPNREDDPQYIVRLVGQVIRVSVETVKIVNGLPKEFA